MSNRGWRYFLAIGLAALLGFGVSGAILLDAWRSQAHYQQQTDKSAQAARDSGAIHAQRACALVPLAERAECQADEYNDARERERNEYDLQAQLVMATWTRAMGLAALVATLTGIIGVGLVHATFAETRRTADAAFRQVRLEEDRRKAEREAMLTLDLRNLSLVFRDDESGTFLSINGQNTGQVSAQDVRATASLTFLNSVGEVLFRQEGIDAEVRPRTPGPKERFSLVWPSRVGYIKQLRALGASEGCIRIALQHSTIVPERRHWEAEFGGTLSIETIDKGEPPILYDVGRVLLSQRTGSVTERREIVPITVET